MKNHIEILLIENIHQHIDVIRQMLNNTNTQHTLHIAKSKAEASDFLRLKDNTNYNTKPDMIFFNSTLDLDVDMNFIQKISSTEDFSHIPVLSLKITDDKIDIVKVIDNYIDYQSTEMIDIEYFIETIVSLKEAMDSLVRLPELVV